MEQDFLQIIANGNFIEHFVNVGALAIPVAAFVAFVKKNIIELHGWQTLLASLITGVAFALLGRQFGLLNLETLPTIFFGIQAAVGASTGWDLFTKQQGKDLPEK